MAISGKEAARRIIDELPEDVTLDDVAARIQAARSERVVESEVVNYHPERRGRFTVLVPDRPTPPMSADIVWQIIEEIRREREQSF